MLQMSKRRVVLAYSGGLDTSVAVKWLTLERNYEVIALSVDVGQGDDLEAARLRALESGAVAAEVVNARDEFVDDFIVPAIKANALYEGKYPLVSALSRPLISKHLVEAADRYGADAVAHGCTGKGNDQVRFEVSIKALNPSLEVEAPVRDWGFTRDDTIDYANAHGVKVSATKKSPYSIDQNIYGRAVECGEMEDPWNSPPADVYEMTVHRKSEPAELVLRFEKGVPVAVDGKAMSAFEIVSHLNSAVGVYGFGRIDMVENRRVGIKSREVYESPAGMALILAHSELEDITLERELAHEKQVLSAKWAEAVYDGLWYSPLKEALDAFFEYAQRYVTGEVRLGLEPNRCFVLGRRAEQALYDFELATYDSRDSYRHQDSGGFVRVFGLGIETWARRQLRRK